MSNDNGQLLLKEKDFVDVVDEEGNDLGYQVPKHWGPEELAPGHKKKSGRGSGGGSSSSSKVKDPAPDTSQEPAGNASTEDWVAFARTKGAADADLLDEKGEPLSRDELRTKYGTPAS